MNEEARRFSPDHPQGIKKVQVGCGPQNILPDWWNIDIRAFPGIDQVMDVTKPWKFSDLEYVYGEHFLEHLSLEEAVSFLNYAWRSLISGGVIRLSTPSLEWVLSTHFNLLETDKAKIFSSTFTINRAFHGWGHQFLYSKEVLTSLLENLGYELITYCNYGESNHPSLKNLERHGGYQIVNNYPSVWIVEAVKGKTRYEEDVVSYESMLDKIYIKYIRGGH